MPVPDGFLAPRVRGDALDGQVNLDEAFGVGDGHLARLCLATWPLADALPVALQPFFVGGGCRH